MAVSQGLCPQLTISLLSHVWLGSPENGHYNVNVMGHRVQLTDDNAIDLDGPKDSVNEYAFAAWLCHRHPGLATEARIVEAMIDKPIKVTNQTGEVWYLETLPDTPETYTSRKIEESYV